MKALLKKTLGGIKLVAALAPMVMLVGGGATLVGSGIAAFGNIARTHDFEYSEAVTREVENYQKEFGLEKASEFYEAGKSLENGELSPENYFNRVKEIESKTLPARNKIVAEIFADDEYYKGLLKKDDINLSVAVTSGSITIVGLVASFCRLFADKPITNIILNSAERDFADAKEIIEEKRRKKAQERRKKALEDEEEKED